MTLQENDTALLLQFSQDHPVWSPRLLELAGVDPAPLEKLVGAGLLNGEDGLFWLTEEGRTAFDEAARECFLNEQAGLAPADPARRAETTELWLALQRAHRQRWGIKDYRFALQIPVHPCSTGRTWRLADGVFSWLWPQSAGTKKALSLFPPVPLRERDPRGSQSLRRLSWRETFPSSEELNADLLYLCRYDYQYYEDFPGYPGDGLRLANADRFFFSFAQTLEEQLDLLGLYQSWLLQLRLADLPGYLDFDTQEQDSVNWLLFVTADETTAALNADRLRALGDLAEPAKPMEIWTVSLQALWAAKPDHEVIWEVLPFVVHPISRTPTLSCCKM